MATDPAIRDLTNRFALDLVRLSSELTPFLLEFAKEAAAIQRDIDAGIAEGMASPTVAQAIKEGRYDADA